MKLLIPFFSILLLSSCVSNVAEEANIIEVENPELVISKEKHTYERSEKGIISLERIITIFYNIMNGPNTPIDSSISEVYYSYKNGQLYQKLTYDIRYKEKELSEIENFSPNFHENIYLMGKDTNHHHIEYYKNKLLVKSVFDDRFSGMEPTFVIKKYNYKGKDLEKVEAYGADHKLVNYTVSKYEKNRLIKEEEYNVNGELLNYSDITYSLDNNLKKSTRKTKYGKVLSYSKSYNEKGTEVGSVNYVENVYKDSMARVNGKETFYINENLKEGSIRRDEYKYDDKGFLIEEISYITKGNLKK
jgi:hypothetical protein